MGRDGGNGRRAALRAQWSIAPSGFDSRSRHFWKVQSRKFSESFNCGMVVCDRRVFFALEVANMLSAQAHLPDSIPLVPANPLESASASGLAGFVHLVLPVCTDAKVGSLVIEAVPVNVVNQLWKTHDQPMQPHVSSSHLVRLLFPKTCRPVPDGSVPATSGCVPFELRNKLKIAVINDRYQSAS